MEIDEENWRSMQILILSSSLKPYITCGMHIVFPHLTAYAATHQTMIDNSCGRCSNGFVIGFNLYVGRSEQFEMCPIQSWCILYTMQLFSAAVLPFMHTRSA